MLGQIGDKLGGNSYLEDGKYSFFEKVLGFPQSSLATHTETRLTKQIQPAKEQTLTIIGQYKPCIPCRGKMNKAAKKFGGTIIYKWRENGKTEIWKAKSTK